MFWFDIYAAGFYVEKAAARRAFAAFLRKHGKRFKKGAGHDLKRIRRSREFYRWLMRTPISRVVDMVYVRSVPGTRVKSVFQK